MKNATAKVLFISGCSIMLLGFIAGVVLGGAGERPFDYVSMIIAWLSGFISGMLFIGIGTIVDQNHKMLVALTANQKPLAATQSTASAQPPMWKCEVCGTSYRGSAGQCPTCAKAALNATRKERDEIQRELREIQKAKDETGENQK